MISLHEQCKDNKLSTLLTKVSSLPSSLLNFICNHSVGALVASPRLHKARARLHEAMPLPAGTAQSGLASLVVSMTSSYSMLENQLQVHMNVQMGEDAQQG